MNFHGMNLAQIIAWAEKQQGAISRASQVAEDLRREKERRVAAEKALAAERSKPPVIKEVIKRVEVPVDRPVEVVRKVEVPKPCPKQAKEIERLEKALSAEKSKPPVVKEVVRKVSVPVEKIKEVFVNVEVPVDREVIKRVAVPEPCPKQAAEIDRLRKAMAAEKAKSPVVKEVVKRVEVAKPCPKQAKEIERLEKALAAEKSKPAKVKEVVRKVSVPVEKIKEVIKRVEVPVEKTVTKYRKDPAQAKRIAALERELSQAKAELASVPKDDIKAAKAWRKMQEVAEQGARA